MLEAKYVTRAEFENLCDVVRKLADLVGDSNEGHRQAMRSIGEALDDMKAILERR